MNSLRLLLLLLIPGLFFLSATPDAQLLPTEKHLRNLKQLTFGGENAEAYFSSDGKQLIFQSTRPGGRPCDEIYTMRLDGTHRRRVSTGTGRTTCAYFYPAAGEPRRLLYASTHAADTACPPRPDM